MFTLPEFLLLEGWSFIQILICPGVRQVRGTSFFSRNLLTLLTTVVILKKLDIRWEGERREKKVWVMKGRRR